MAVDDETSAIEDVRFLTRAESRVRILKRLLVTDTTTQRELRTELEASRTTVSRSLQSLLDREWVETTDDGYRLTGAGRIVAVEVERLLETVNAVGELSGFLRWFPSDVDWPDVRELDDFEVVNSTDADPYAPARAQTEILRTAERLRILLPAIDLESTETIVEQVTERGLVVETIVSPGVESTMESDEFASLLREKLRTGRSAVLVAEELLPFYLCLADDGRVQVGLADDEGFPRSLLETTDPNVRSWAEDLYRDYGEGARRKPLEEF